MWQKIKTTLYHGTISEIEKIDVSLGRDKKDFGKGFYLAVSKKQAIGMMHKKYKEASKRRTKKNTQSEIKEYLYEIKLNKDILKELNIKVFEEIDIEWLDFVLKCRKEGGIPHDYDLVIGGTADDDTALCLKAYFDGMYGKIDSIEAKRILLRNLETENLGIQYYIGKQEVADKLIEGIKEIEWRK